MIVKSQKDIKCLMDIKRFKNIKSLKDIKRIKGTMRLSEGEEYIASEITINKVNRKAYFKIESEDGNMGLIESKNVSILNASLDNMVYKETEGIITIKLVKE